MKDDRAALHGFLEATLLEKIRRKEVDGTRALVSNVLQILKSVLLGSVSYRSVNREALIEKLLDENSSDVARVSCNDDRVGFVNGVTHDLFTSFCNLDYEIMRPAK
jgi:DNA helicase HerA-like ATPase